MVNLTKQGGTQAMQTTKEHNTNQATCRLTCSITASNMSGRCCSCSRLPASVTTTVRATPKLS
jgi:hypothetical protein